MKKQPTNQPTDKTKPTRYAPCCYIYHLSNMSVFSVASISVLYIHSVIDRISVLCQFLTVTLFWYCDHSWEWRLLHYQVTLLVRNFGHSKVKDVSIWAQVFEEVLFIHSFILSFIHSFFHSFIHLTVYLLAVVFVLV